MADAEGPDVRIEHDSMGEVAVPAWARWAAQTQRATENFPISGIRIDPRLIAALAAVKGAAAVINARMGVVDGEIADAVVMAANEVTTGAWDDHFPIDVFQTGSGTSSNMNANEVIANLAAERLGRPVHPNDHVNASQSSNDVFPSALHLAAATGIVEELVPALQHLASALRHKAAETAGVVKAGRTHLMDATPVTLGQELSGYATAVEHGVDRARATLPRLCELALGGTAVGTGINVPPGFATAVIERLAAASRLPLREASDHFEAQGGRDAVVEASGALRTVALSLARMANDLRLMASGPRAGIAEIRLPDLQPGSSIMPGKVNPVIPEAVVQVAAQVVGNDAAIAFGATAGAFELNTAMPMMARNLLESIHLLAAVSRLLADRCVAGIEADVARCRANAESSSALATALSPHIGYEEAAAVVRQSAAEGKTLREVVLERGLLRPGEVDRILDVEAMTRGGVL
ncbi:MAG TPA: class II fumarate hydratase [Acidimicrobiales bacterium]|jgi:fumarate hydratase class II|nr:class II fumarate hydratase [Acidimicrobiales bacterium]